MHNVVVALGELRADASSPATYCSPMSKLLNPGILAPTHLCTAADVAKFSDFPGFCNTYSKDSTSIN